MNFVVSATAFLPYYILFSDLGVLMLAICFLFIFLAADCSSVAPVAGDERKIKPMQSRQKPPEVSCRLYSLRLSCHVQGEPSIFIETVC